MPDLQLCIRCGGGPWPPQCFYRSGTRRDGTVRRDKKCKRCRKQLSADYRIGHSEQISQRDRAQYQDPERRTRKLDQHKKYVKTASGKAARRRATRAWRVTHPEAYEALKKRNAEALRRKRFLARTSPPEQHDERATTI